MNTNTTNTKETATMTPTTNPNITDLGWITRLGVDQTTGQGKWSITPTFANRDAAAQFGTELVGTEFDAPQGGRYRITHG